MSYFFDGGNDKIQFSGAQWDETGDWFLSIWALYDHDDNNAGYLAGRWLSNDGWFLRLNSTENCIFGKQDGKAANYVDAGLLPNLSWGNAIIEHRAADGSIAIFKNGVLMQQDATGDALVAAATDFVLGNRADNQRDFRGFLAEPAAWQQLSTAQIRADLQTKTPDNIGLPPVFFAGLRADGDVSGGVVTGAVFDAEHPTLTGPAGGVTLAVSDASHAHSADGVSLTQKSTLSVAEAAHNQSSDSVDLVQQNTVNVAESLHSHSADSLALMQKNTVAVNPSSHSHVVDNVDLVQSNVLVVSDSGHSVSSDNVVLSTGVLLAVQETLHSLISDTPALIQKNLLTVQEALHSIGSDNLVLSNAVSLSVFDSVHGHSADNVELTQAHVLAVQGALHSLSSDTLAVTQEVVLVVDSTLHALISDNINLIDGDLVTPAERTFVVPAENRVFVIPFENRVYIIRR